MATPGRAQVGGFATGVGCKADIGACAADPTLVYQYTAYPPEFAAGWRR